MTVAARVFSLMAMCLLGAASPVSWAAPHTHGVSHLEVALDGPRLELTWRAALDDVVGFEHAPRTPAQQQQVAQAMERLRQPQALFVPSAVAACELKTSQVSAPLWQGGATTAGHADLTLQAQWACGQPQQLLQLEVLVFESFKRVRQINTQVVTARGQHKITLRGKVRIVALNR